MRTLILALAFCCTSAFKPPLGAGRAAASPRTVRQSEAPAAEPAVAAAAPAPSSVGGAAGGFVAENAAQRGLVELQASTCNGVIPFYDPLNLAQMEFWDQSNEATIGFLRHAEIKHGRVAMAGFVGWLVQEAGGRFPFPIQLDGTGFPSKDLSPPEQWDALSGNAKAQIIAFIGFLEIFGEYEPERLGMPDEEVIATQGKSSHYMRGGKPGVYPKQDNWPLQLYDPFNFSKKASEEKKAKSLIAELNNGRLAMVGLFGFIAESKVPGAVPALAAMQGTASEVKPYAGDFMVPFAGDFTLFGDVASAVAAN